MKQENRARYALARAGALVIAVIAAFAPATASAGANAPLAEYQYSYEDGLQGWTPKTDQDTGTPECSPHASEVVHSDDRAKDGTHSVNFRADGTHDCGLLWIERRFDAGTTDPVQVALTLSLYSEDTGDAGAGGLNRVQAHVGADCVTDPVLGGSGWDGFHDIAPTSHTGGPGWYGYYFKHNQVTPAADGTVCVGQAVKIASTYPFVIDYYLDETTVTIS
ncbi:hypothetical protein [Saccharothrix australiensis]|uniref:Secreted protein n=1 Tax=Saccharothrix australiensis TaxID=2072 RepID=A0A495VXV7_9PSEU|nr:hypothetical protein [Saccharothrix australiensis]RKT54034.1 hypothetical protein C8E97_2623 [Saccharothrix australiensis]